jgi:UDP-N-acetylglucosamine--N-acetylmuramyl-(pentapeptide) pyrophosphoryl-undecaprenol N-acetylglucosamine transferase
MKIIFTGGGSGGHIYPLIAVIRELKKLKSAKDLSLIYMGPKDNFSDTAMKGEDVKVVHIRAGKIRRYLDPYAFFQNILDVMIMIPLGMIQSFIYIFVQNPDLVYSKGGYGSYPVALAAGFLGVPVFLQESDSSPGLASRKLSKKALEIFISFPDTEFFPKGKMIMTGNPIRSEVVGYRKEEAQKALNLTGGKPVVLIIGGSQGAQRINDKLLDTLPDTLKNYEIIHQTGKKNFEQVKKEAKAMLKDDALYYHPVAFFDDKMMACAYAAADLVISRSGSGSIFEIAANKLPSIMIPLPEAAQNHQVKNAYRYARSGAALIIEENNFTSNFFHAKIKDLVSDKARMKAMSEAAGAFSRPRAAREIAEYTVNYLTK